MLLKQDFSYNDNNTTLIGRLAYDDNSTNKKPLVLIVHDWSGRNDFYCKKAEKIASIGYAGFAVDMYGNAKIGANNEEKIQLMKPLMSDRTLLLQRITAALDAVKKIKQIDVDRIAIMGFCFGGLCALDLARTNAKIIGAISLHGNLTSPSKKPIKKINSKILVLHGHDDPRVPPKQVRCFEKEMIEAKADWQIHSYGGTKHSFTNPLANDKKLGLEYNETADKRSWIATKNFLTEIFCT